MRTPSFRKVLWTTIGLTILVLVWAFASYPSTYVWRVMFWLDSDVQDYRRFPDRPVDVAGTPFRFVDAPDETRVRAIFGNNPLIGDLDTFLVETGTQAFIVIQNDRVLYEKYFHGYQRDSVVTSFSVAKSFDSALVGIAIDEGYIRSVDDPITDYLPELAEREARFKKITIKDLLKMSSGIKYQEFPFFTGDDAKTYYYPNMRQLALEETTVDRGPGEQFLYNNYNPLLLGLIIERATGTSVADYLQEKIWEPLGMEFPGSWSLDSQASGFEKMESGINGRAIDFAKFGRLYLNEGNWDGTQVIPAEWVTRSTQDDELVNRAAYYPATEFFGAMKGYYGYMWWGRHRTDGNYDFSARGKHGQFVYVSPHKNLIIVRNGERYGIDGYQWLEAFFQFASALEPLQGADYENRPR